jgi:hypothetical protein
MKQFKQGFPFDVQAALCVILLVDLRGGPEAKGTWLAEIESSRPSSHRSA